MNNWEKELTGETNVFWKVINKRITPETQQFIHLFISSLLSKQREEILGKVKKFNTKNHICRFNDGESNCECYNQALSDIEKEI